MMLVDFEEVYVSCLLPVGLDILLIENWAIDF
jgi:hypothetical protein